MSSSGTGAPESWVPSRPSSLQRTKEWLGTLPRAAMSGNVFLGRWTTSRSFPGPLSPAQMSAIRLADAAKHDAGLPHQLAAWNELQETLTAKQLEDFAEAFRAAPKPKTGLFVSSSPFSYKLTPNVTYGELAQQSEARRFVAQHQCDTALVLAQFVQKARDHFGGPAIITSGHRPPGSTPRWVVPAVQSTFTMHRTLAPSTSTLMGPPFTPCRPGLTRSGRTPWATAHQKGLFM